MRGSARTQVCTLVGLAKVEGSNSDTDNLALGLALDVFCTAEGKYQTVFFHNN